MSEILLNSKVIVYLLSEGILYTLSLIGFLVAIYLLKKWDFSSFSELQFRLEEIAYLIVTLITFIFLAKVGLIFYFIFTIDALSLQVPGAMCAAGVISANSYGLTLLAIKLFIIFGLLLWIFINYLDLEAKNYPYFKLKMALFLVVFLFLTIELTLDFLYFLNIDTNRPVSCCSTLYGQLEGANPLPFGLDIKTLLILFYSLYFVTIFSLFFRQYIINLIATALFLYISYYSVVYFFGTYIYELPTHKCPFCMFAKEYYYIGYLLWGTLFLGAFLMLINSLIALFLKKDIKLSSFAQLLITLFVIISTLYVAIYYFKNGVFL
ncbi:MAG: hypothetical protein GXN91_04830 [Epsilonproteobacteria bacterium]|nr:hypothetical protein [Campylobacterota bacterium]